MAPPGTFNFVTGVWPNRVASDSSVAAPLAARAFRNVRRSVIRLFLRKRLVVGSCQLVVGSWSKPAPRTSSHDPIRAPHITRSKGLHKGKPRELPLRAKTSYHPPSGGGE